MATKCICSDARSRHRQQYGEPFSGPCRDCGCQAFQAGGGDQEMAGKKKQDPPKGKGGDKEKKGR